MSRPAPTKRSNSILFALWLISLFLLIQLFTNRPAGETVPTGNLLGTLRTQNQQILDVSAASTNMKIASALDQQVKEKKISAAEAEAKKIEAVVLTADVQLKAGLQRNDLQRLRNAYALLWNYQKRLIDKPEWKDVKVQVPYDAKYGFKEWSGQELHDYLVKTLSEKNKKELIWGFVPGGYQFIDALVALTGRVPGFSYAFAAFLLALIVRAIVFPLAQKQFMFGRQMSQLAPLTNEIKEQFKDDPQRMQQKTMELYKEYGINPFSGCGPALVQMPLFLTVYQFMLLYQFEFQKGTFLWINESMSKATHGWIAPNLGQQDVLVILLYTVSGIATTLLTPVSDPNQKRQQRGMGIAIWIIFTFFMFTGAFPVVGGFVLYWTFTNLLTTLQSLYTYRLPLPPLVKKNTVAGGVYASDPMEAFPWLKKRMEQQQAKNGQVPDSNSSKKQNQSTGKPKQHKPRK